MSSVACDHKVVATLVLHHSDQHHSPLEIREADRLFVGSDESSDIRVIDDEVAATHCVISAAGGSVTVEDCYSHAGTFVDEHRVREMQLTENADVRVGPVVISVKLNTHRQPESDEQHDRDLDSDRSHGAPDCGSASNPDRRARDVRAEATQRKNEDLGFQLAQAHAEIEVLQSRLTGTMAISDSAADPYQDEMIELLRAEVVDLQTALAERDHAEANPSPAASCASSAGDVLSQADAEKLVARLEQLLQELQQRDGQIAVLTELLETAETTTRAEREERSQLDAWVQDIEERFGYREQEWRLQRNKLQEAVDTMAAERDRAEAAVHADSSNAKLEAAQQVMLGLRDTAESQRQLILKSEQTITQLQRELEQAKHSHSRAEMAQLAEERAELARQRQELETMRHRMQRSGANDATLKLQALRQHLNEIHEQERKEQQERKLSSRIARLWSRLDG